MGMALNWQWSLALLRAPAHDCWATSQSFISVRILLICVFFFLEALFDSMIGSQIPGDPFMSQRILSSSSLPLRQRSDKPPWCECAPFLGRAKSDGEGGKFVKSARSGNQSG